jgi:hypothetical protein
MSKLYSLSKLELLSEDNKTSAPAKIKLFSNGVNPSTKGDFFYNPELKSLLEENFKKDGRDKLPIDLAHLSLDSNSQTIDSFKSYGWWTPEFSDDGLYANIEWTDEGKNLVETKSFRFFSPAFEINENNEIVYLENFALTNSPALQNIEPIILSKLEEENNKELIMTTDNVETLSSVEDVKPEDKKEEAELQDEQMSPEDMMKTIESLNAQVTDLQSQLSQKDELVKQLEAKLMEYENAAVEAEKDVVLNSMELSKEEKDFFSTLELNKLKEYSKIRLSKLESEKRNKIELENNSNKTFVLSKAPEVKSIQETKKLDYLPSKEEIQERARKIAAQRNKV